jgi:hypothetical protein
MPCSSQTNTRGGRILLDHGPAGLRSPARHSQIRDSKAESNAKCSLPGMSDTRKSIKCYFELARQQLPAGKSPGAPFSTKRVFKAKDRILWLSLSELIGITFSELIGISRRRRRSFIQENRSDQLRTCANYRHELTRACERKVSGFTATQVVECHLLRT